MLKPKISQALMHKMLTHELEWLASGLLFSAILGLFFQSLLIAVLAFSGLLLLYYLINFLRFAHWFLTSPNSPPPNLWGGWHLLSLRLYKHATTTQHQLIRARSDQSRIHLALMQQPDAVIALDPRFKIEWLNFAASRLLGLAQTDRGKKIESFLRAPEFIRYLHEGTYERSLQIYSALDPHRMLDIQAVRYDKGYVLLVVRDITEMHHIAEIRKDFVANASHELRTPLTVLSGYLEMMTDAEDLQNTPWLPALQQMQEQADRMRNIIEDLLTLSTLESKGLQPAETAVNVPELLKQLEKDLQRLSAGRHQIHFTLSPECQIIGHQDALKSVFMNLLSNAVHYTPEGGKIQVTWRCDAESAIFEVKDSGIGIPREHIARVTERFFRVDTARSRETGGTGLGLAIVKHILENYGARLEIESQYHIGSTFRCRFPREVLINPAHKNNGA